MLSRIQIARRGARAFSSATGPLKGRKALVTGSTSGIGQGIALELARAGADLVIHGFGDKSAVLELQQHIETTHGVKTWYAEDGDLLHVDRIEAMMAAHPTIDILVNNAGIQHVAAMEAFPVQKWDDIIAINLSSVFHTSKAALPHMKRQGWGRIINISSVHGLVGSPHKSAYVAAKHGVVGMTKVVALETAGTGVTANCINPGWVLTPLVQVQLDAIVKEKGMTMEEATTFLLSSKQPSQKFVTPRDLGQTAVFLCSEAASQLTGTSIPVDGGWTAQ